MKEISECEVNLSILDELGLSNDLIEGVKDLVETIISNNRGMPSSIISAIQEIDNFSKDNLSGYEKDFVNTFKTNLLDVILFTKKLNL